MIPLVPPLRVARREDAPVLAELVNFAGHGLPLALWRDMAGPDGDPWALGVARQAEKAEAGQIVVVDEGAGAVAGLTGYPIRKAEEIGAGFPPVIRPLQELENLAIGSWYVNVLAALPEHRGKGWGGRLLSVAEEIAAAEGLDSLSLIVAGDNDGAHRLYERAGYVEHARRPVISAPDWTPQTAQWILMVRPLRR